MDGSPNLLLESSVNVSDCDRESASEISGSSDNCLYSSVDNAGGYLCNILTKCDTSTISDKYDMFSTSRVSATSSSSDTYLYGVHSISNTDCDTISSNRSECESEFNSDMNSCIHPSRSQSNSNTVTNPNSYLSFYLNQSASDRLFIFDRDQIKVELGTKLKRPPLEQLNWRREKSGSNDDVSKNNEKY